MTKSYWFDGNKLIFSTEIINAGYGVSEEETNESISSSSLEIKSTSKEVRRGKYTLSINKETTLEQIKSIIGE